MWRKSRLKIIESKKNDFIWLLIHCAVQVRYALKSWGYIDSDICASCSRVVLLIALGLERCEIFSRLFFAAFWGPLYPCPFPLCFLHFLLYGLLLYLCFIMSLLPSCFMFGMLVIR